MCGNAGWHRAATLDQVTEDEPLALQVGERRIALFRVGEEIFATDDVCTHAFALLSDGLQEGCVIECPLHNARFEVRTGRALSSPAERDLDTFPVRVAGEAIEILLPA
ncbi:non-heme iron oxygenase ferredoxin subunit [Roseomonas indoligenes]|uniref:Non-heme iron oxygenase ferredoxin subunit n=1 Tax=Roseomonas indoligenes TaxID=2820811 RepID=A0A940N7G6_9PROT|nr:non-heme iron oxygenase ferredoxin subunit [Pararoseomonas indoligenes]MBP0496550.1 non-heme iron oxygenase ferredoxin subunit [Pararoseomonas indoligenes]